MLEGAASSGFALAPNLAAFLFGQAAPHATVLVRVERELEALGLGSALHAHALSSSDLVQCCPGRTDREEQRRVGVAAKCNGPPIGDGINEW